MKTTFRRTSIWVVLALTSHALASSANAVKRRAFVTSTSGTGNLSSWAEAGGATGLAAGDNVCRARAAASGLPNANAYRAWLSSPTTDAFCHVQGLSGEKSTSCDGAVLPGAGPWYLMNGITSFTADLEALTGAQRKIYRPVILDEYGEEVSFDERHYRTGTLPDGTAYPVTCSNWTNGFSNGSSAVGDALATAELWTSGDDALCSDELRLLCLEPGASESVNLRWSPGALAFVTSSVGDGDLGSWAGVSEGEGIEAGDTICRNLAAAAHLPQPDSFVAWLSDAWTDAVDRVTVNGPFRRVDAFAIAYSKTDLVDGALPNSLHVDERGRYLAEAGDSWTGSVYDGTFDGYACDDWSAWDAGSVGQTGVAASARSGSWTYANVRRPCSQSKHLYCFSNVVTIFWDGFEITGDTSRWAATVP